MKGWAIYAPSGLCRRYGYVRWPTDLGRIAENEEARPWDGRPPKMEPPPELCCVPCDRLAALRDALAEGDPDAIAAAAAEVTGATEPR